MRCGEHRVRRRGARRRRAPHRGQQRLRAGGFRGDRPVDLRVPHPHAGLVRHRLQRAGRQVRPGVRGPGRRHRPAGRGFPHRRVQPQHLGCGDARRLRRRAADTDPTAHRRTAARLAARAGPRRPKGHSRADVGRRLVHPLPARRHPDPADDLHPPRRRQHRLPGQRRLCGDGPDPRHRRAFQRSARPADLEDSLRGGAIFANGSRSAGRTARWAHRNHRRRPATGSARYATFDKGAVYWSPASGAEPLTGAIYEAWASLGYERGALGLPTSGEIQEPQWIVQNFQHGTLNFDRENGTVTRVIDGVASGAAAAVRPTGRPVSSSGSHARSDRCR